MLKNKHFKLVRRVVGCISMVGWVYAGYAVYGMLPLGATLLIWLSLFSSFIFSLGVLITGNALKTSYDNED